MTTMTISPIQPIKQDYVTKREFEEFTHKVDEGFDMVFDHADIIENKIDSLKIESNKRFDNVDKRFDAVDNRFNTVNDRFNTVNDRFDAVDDRFNTVNDRFVEQKTYMNERFDEHDVMFSNIEKRLGMLNKDVSNLREEIPRHMKILLEGFREDLETSLEFLRNSNSTKLQK